MRMDRVFGNPPYFEDKAMEFRIQDEDRFLVWSIGSMSSSTEITEQDRAQRGEETTQNHPL
jgi:hypothetical protein